MNFKLLATAALAFAGLGCAFAQALNIDLDAFLGDQGTGNGAPSSGFGGAAGVAGYWNRVFAGAFHDPLVLSGLDGALTSVQYFPTGGVGSGGGFANHSNTGDFALLLNDYANVGDEIDYHFSGFQPGRYKIFTYAVNATGFRVNTTVTVPGADDPVKFVTGPMPGNQFTEGITHSVHDLTVVDGSFQIDVSGPWPDTEVNGFQIIAVPEPMSALVVTAGLAALLCRKHK